MDAMLNPPAGSGRRDDASLDREGEKIVLPAGTRKYTDAGGSKHFLLPDGTTRFVPPGELGNFVLEDESQVTSLRRMVYEKLDGAAATQAIGLVESLLDTADDLRRHGIVVDILPSADVHPDEHEASLKAKERAGRTDWPKMKYHEDGSHRVVKNEDEERDLGGGWGDDPYAAKKKAEQDEKAEAKDEAKPVVHREMEPVRDPREQPELREPLMAAEPKPSTKTSQQ